MRKRIAIIMLCFYCIGNILFPAGYPVCLHDMYRHCAAEDPDINAMDFVVEHLMNIPDVFDYFESDQDNEENERPHQPFQQAASSFQVLVALDKPITFECRQLLSYEDPAN